MTEQINLDFLIIVASTSATLMGFAFITPVIQTLSTGIFNRAGGIIQPNLLLDRIFIITSLPILVFLLPFLSSLLLLIYGETIGNNVIVSDSTQTKIKLISILFALVGLILFYKIKNYLKLENFGSMELIKKSPLAFFWVYIVMSITIYCRYNFAFFFYFTNLIFMILGLLLILLSLTTSMEKGIKFKPNQITPSSQHENGFLEQTKADLERMNKALINRNDKINKLKQLTSSYIPEKLSFWHQYISKHESERWFLQKEYNGSKDPSYEGLSQRWNKLTKYNEFTLVDLFDFEDDKEKVIKDYLLEFERKTEELRTLIERLDSKSVSEGLNE